MAYKFNPLTGQFDLVNPSTGGGSGDVVGPAGATSDNIATYDGVTGKLIKDSGVSIDAIEAYSQSFIVGDWVGPSGGSYTLTILKATHKQNNPMCVLYELNGSDYIQVEAGIKINASEDVIISVNDVPDNRFVGKIVIN